MRKYILVCLLFVTALPLVRSQSLKKYPIDKSGCSAYFFCDPGKFDLETSPDSSKVYTGECKQDGVIYDIICVRMKDRIKELNAAEEVLLQYLDYLKSNFQITGSTGYGKGHKLRGREDTRGIIDYWTDKDKNNIRVKGWTDGQFIAVLIIISPTALQDTKANLYLDGIVFPTSK